MKTDFIHEREVIMNGNRCSQRMCLSTAMVAIVTATLSGASFAVEVSHPVVYVEETNANAKPIPGVETSTTGYGIAPRPVKKSLPAAQQGGSGEANRAKVSSMHKSTDVTLKRGVVQDNGFNDWKNNVRTGENKPSPSPALQVPVSSTPAAPAAGEANPSGFGAKRPITSGAAVDAPQTGLQVDPYQKYRYRLKWQGRDVAGFDKTALLKSAAPNTEVAQDTVRKAPSHSRFDAITLDRGVTHDTEFSDWATQSSNKPTTQRAAFAAVSFRDMAIETYNEAGQRVSSTSLVRCQVVEFQAMLDPDGGSRVIMISHARLKCLG